MSSGLRLRMLSSTLARSSAIPRSRWLARQVHLRRPLLYNLEDGLGKFLPPSALQTAVDWQEGLLEHLNEEVVGTSEENTSVTQTVINTSTLKERTLAFNYASLALNNGYFLDQLKPLPAQEESHEKDIAADLLTAIEENYGSLRQLKSSVSAAALGMFSNGWVWFVADANGTTGILPTFGPGTLLVRSRTYMAAEKGLVLGDKYTDLPPSSVTPSPTSRTPPPGTGSSSPTSGTPFSNSPRTPTSLGPRFVHTPASSFPWTPRDKPSIYNDSDGSQRTVANILNVGETLFPLFCIPVYEHSWMSAGFGVWGKEEWLKEFWTVLDWAKVSKAYNLAKSSKNTTLNSRGY